jgi:hypothetical protein
MIMTTASLSDVQPLMRNPPLFDYDPFGVRAKLLLVDLSQGLSDAVQNHGDQDDACAANARHARLEAAHALEDGQTQATRSDEGGDDHHVQGQQDAPVRSGHTRGQGMGGLDLA